MTRQDTTFRAAVEGATVAHRQFRTELDVETKDSKMDFVTQADTDTQQRVIEIIKDRYPEATIVGEEEDERKSLPDDGNAWVIDPIDGTTNFVRGVHLWTTTVAAVRDHETVAATTVAPALDDVYTVDSNGTMLNGEQTAVSMETDPEQFIVAPILRYGSERDEEFGNLLRGLIRQFGDLRRFGCAQVTLGMVASGAIDAAVSTQPEPNPWDTIAGVYLVEQAGGTVTDIDGTRWTPDAEGIVATNGTRHDEVVEHVAQTVR
ncbi:inositol monophosphatase [Haladaptatus sp. R4]|uniref:inositol monophosphatase family protein n=1 Tax=Haladaptatus sp. R4 TaxID=1679489 RepID=UPI0007B4C86A|nr:inositol monophosphatase [Haladaptatus sp. R4]KZN23234.1 inositol monophosphatase [Haladaptatus sp. R4]